MPQTAIARHRHPASRREFLRYTAAVAALSALSATDGASAQAANNKRLGLVTYSCRTRRDHLKQLDSEFELFDPSRFLAYCQQIGAGGMQIDLGKLDPPTARALRRQAEQTGLYIEAIISVPFEAQDVDRFTAELQTAKEAGATVARTTIIPGRRYERFDTLAAFREFEARGRKALEMAAPIAEKHQVAIAVENHKDHRNEERVALFEHISSDFVGACVDTGNSVALLEDPIETVQSLAPWAHSVHLKDQSVQPDQNGFLLADIPLGQGSLDVVRMVKILREKKPQVNFSLELITRDPLSVPILTEKYWATFPDLPASLLARHTRFIQSSAKDNLQYVSRMSAAERLAREDANVRESLAYARQHLDL